jgi:hypothetical protein
MSVHEILLRVFALAAVLAMWFVLVVGHGQKDVGDIYAPMAVTGIPFFLASFGLWRRPAASSSS